MYLYFFERILRAASGGPTLTLPYWNYAKATPMARALPAPFRTPTTGNPLFVAQRNPPINTGAFLPSSAVSTTVALGTPLHRPSWQQQQFWRANGGGAHSFYEPAWAGREPTARCGARAGGG